MKKKFVVWPWVAEDAQARGDWASAKEAWYRAAENASDGDLRARYNEREDRAEAMRRAAA